MSDRTVYVADADQVLQKARPSEVPDGTSMIRIGLLDGTEHHISTAEGASYSLDGGMLLIVGRGRHLRVYASWAWVDIAPHKVPKTAPPRSLR